MRSIVFVVLKKRKKLPRGKFLVKKYHIRFFNVHIVLIGVR